MKLILKTLSLLIFCCLLFCQAIKDRSLTKINGVSFVSPPKAFDDSLIRFPKQKIKANWLCLMPFGFIGSSSNQVTYNGEWQWWGEKKAGIEAMIKMAKKEGYQLMLKPQIWIRHGAFTGHHKYDIESDWSAFEASYSQFILDYAEVAEKHHVELFCIGTELEAFTQGRPLYWQKLIKRIRSIYSGQLTYASNWDEYKRVPFWRELDYIGIDAYFPMSKNNQPSEIELKETWKALAIQLENFSEQNDKLILLTEYGYRSKEGSAIEPWDSNPYGAIDLNLQIKMYEALYSQVWSKDFVVGGFIWKWFPNHLQSGGKNNNGFTPQNKPVEAIIRKYYGLDSRN